MMQRKNSDSKYTLFSDSENKKNTNEMLSIENIILEGKFLGSGKNGNAYLVGDKVYKIYHEYYSPSSEYDPAKRSAKYWNQVYNQIYAGKFKYLATASFVTMKMDEKKFHVLICPYIDSEEISSYDTKNHSKIKKELKLLGLKMIDQCVPGNIRVYGENKDPLPIDFDIIVPASSKSKNCCCFSFLTFPSETSPVAKHFINSEYGNLFVKYQSLDEKKPLISKLSS